MKPLPFRHRLTLWSTVVAAVALTISAILTALFIHRKEVSRLDENLKLQSTHFFSELERHGGASKFDWRKIKHEVNEWLPPIHGPQYVIITTSGTERWRSKSFPEEGCDVKTNGITTLTCGQFRARFIAEEKDGVRFVLGTDFSNANTLLSSLAWALTAALPIALAFAFFGGLRLASAAVSPLEQMTTAAEHIAADQISKRLPVPPTDDEVRRHAIVLNNTFDRLERSYRQALRFSADASHELKTPIAVIRAGLESLIESPKLAEPEQHTLGGLLEQTRRLSDMIAGLLLLARADAGRLELDRKPHDIVAITEACVEDARIIAEDRGLSFQSCLPDSAAATIDAMRFSQILSNLLSNAVKYNIPGGEIRISLTSDDTDWRISVANTGPSIPEPLRPQLFERFFRAEHTSDGGQGLGLGLARELARAHGGDVELLRSEGGWNEFVFRFPKTIAG